MVASVYIDTTIVSYLTAWPSRDLVRQAQQQQTREWWDMHSVRFELCCSEFVIIEASAGDAAAAAERLRVLDGMRTLLMTEDARALADALVDRLALPRGAVGDAIHVGIAATNGIEYLLTWNCRHLANAVLRPMIESVCVDMNVEPPVICTPAELMD